MEDILMQMAPAAEAYMQQPSPEAAAQLVMMASESGDPDLMMMLADTLASAIMDASAGGGQAMPQDPAAMGGAPMGGAPMGQPGMAPAGMTPMGRYGTQIPRPRPMYKSGGMIKPRSAVEKLMDKRKMAAGGKLTGDDPKKKKTEDTVKTENADGSVTYRTTRTSSTPGTSSASATPGNRKPAGSSQTGSSQTGSKDFRGKTSTPPSKTAESEEVRIPKMSQLKPKDVPRPEIKVSLSADREKPRGKTNSSGKVTPGELGKKVSEMMKTNPKASHSDAKKYFKDVEGRGLNYDDKRDAATKAAPTGPMSEKTRLARMNLKKTKL